MSRHIRKYAAIVALSVAGTAFQLFPTSCADYAFRAAVSAVDFCSVVNCSGGTFVNLCYPVPLFVDCPNTVLVTENP